MPHDSNFHLNGAGVLILLESTYTFALQKTFEIIIRVVLFYILQFANQLLLQFEKLYVTNHLFTC